uniref:Uncharacterized protein MANES_02G207700 n=1 Tax=Rhizophora mucronata TaxID=61149 RepID=A0A2P2L1A1_RHIMU
MPYGYQQRGPYSSQSGQYPPPAYGGYPPQRMAPRANYGWEQRPPLGVRGPLPHSGGYASYSGQGGHPPDHPFSGSLTTGHASGPAPAMGPPSQSSYNYEVPHGLNYGHPAPYPQTAPPQQTNGQRFDELNYDSHATLQHPYGHGNSQPVYQQVGSQPGYGAQQQGKQSSYVMPSQTPPPQSYSHPRTAQPGDLPCQGTVQSTQSDGPNVSQQQQYQYPTSVPMQQAYPSYGSASVTDGYNQAMAASGPGYPQQGGQPIPAYGQPSGQPAAGHVQGPAGAYGSYASLQQSYPEQPTPNNTSYGYQAPQDSSCSSASGPLYGAPPSGQQVYTQLAPTQPSYDQSVQQPGAYATTAESAPAGYGKTLSSQPNYPQYDSNQVYIAQQ